jgi:hypothetical protein
VQALATHRTCVDASSSCGVRYVDLVALASKDSVRAVAIAVLHSHTKDHRRMSNSGANPVADEWMYVQNTTASDAASPFNRCFELLQRNDCEGALALYHTVALECDKARETVHEDGVVAALLPPPRLQQMMDALLANSTVDNLVICHRVEQLHCGAVEKAV